MLRIWSKSCAKFGANPAPGQHFSNSDQNLLRILSRIRFKFCSVFASYSEQVLLPILGIVCSRICSTPCSGFGQFLLRIWSKSCFGFRVNVAVDLMQILLRLIWSKPCSGFAAKPVQYLE